MTTTFKKKQCNCIDNAITRRQLFKQFNHLPYNSVRAPLEMKYLNLQTDFTTKNCDKGCESLYCMYCLQAPMYVNLLLDKYKKHGYLKNADKVELSKKLQAIINACFICNCSDCSDLVTNNKRLAETIFENHTDLLLPTVYKK